MWPDIYRQSLKNPLNLYHPPGFSFQDFDLLVEGGVLYACYVKKIPYNISNSDSRQPNRYAMAKSHDGVNWEDMGDIILPTSDSWEETIWAGGISKQDGGFIIYYTGTTMAGRNNLCKIGKAYSQDLTHWQKYLKNPVFVFDPQNPYYSGEPKLAFRDPFFFGHQGQKYIIFCAKDKAQPAGRQGCVGIAEELNSGEFQWMPPLFSPGIYFDGLECPALYEISGKWYLLYGLDRENGGKTFRYTIADSPFGPFTAFADNQLLPENNYTCRIVNFKGKLLLYYWTQQENNGAISQMLALPKEVKITQAGKISLLDLD